MHRVRDADAAGAADEFGVLVIEQRPEDALAVAAAEHAVGGHAGEHVFKHLGDENLLELDRRRALVGTPLLILVPDAPSAENPPTASCPWATA